jgi:predicted oxidoreductase (fatty acid repression mutant protein)
MWSLPSTWVIKAQMPFGGKAAGPQDKEFAPIDERVKVAGAKAE